MREGWNVLMLNGKGDGRELLVVAAGVERSEALKVAEKVLSGGEKRVYVVRASKVVILDASDMKASLPKGVI